MLTTHKQQAGVTLVELMIGLLVGLIVIAAGLNIFTTSIRGQTDNINLTRLNQDMRSMMDIMVRDIRRAGFWTSQPDLYIFTPLLNPQVQTNPFFDSTTNGATTDLAVYNTGSCIVYAYNYDNDSPPVVDSSDRLGFRLNNDGELQMRSSGSSNEDCNYGTWESITEPEVEITALAFTLTTATLNVTSMVNDKDGDDNGNGICDTGEACNTCTTGQACLYVRNVAISLTGRLRDDNTVVQTITEQVRVRNDKYLATAP
jgi:prepilin peptidase dependent protein B